jgi:hypothetical protein
MGIEERLESFIRLGIRLDEFIKSPDDPAHGGLREAVARAENENRWFTRDYILLSIAAISEMLRREKLNRWLGQYRDMLNVRKSQITVGVIMAGNIPLVGFHDFLCVLMSGNRIAAKMSGQDAVLLPCLADMLVAANPQWKERIYLTRDRLPSFDAIIATGSNNSSRYFEYYFGKYPHIIRKNRTSVAILTGEETGGEISSLVDDMLLYFGMGCRSVSKLFLPSGYDLVSLIKATERYSSYAFHNKYRNNYDYFKSIYLVNKVPFLDNGFLVFQENKSLSSPVSVVYYEYYSDADKLKRELSDLGDQLQCIVTAKEIGIPTIRPGMAQHPEVWDYADNIDTMDFLLNF